MMTSSLRHIYYYAIWCQAPKIRHILPVTCQHVTFSIVPLLSKFIPAHLLPTLLSLLLNDVIIYYVIELFVQINRIAFTFDICKIDYKDVIRSIHLKTVSFHNFSSLRKFLEKNADGLIL